MALQLKKYEPLPDLVVRGNNYQAPNIAQPSPGVTPTNIAVGGNTSYYKPTNYASWNAPTHPTPNYLQQYIDKASQAPVFGSLIKTLTDVPRGINNGVAANAIRLGTANITHNAVARKNAEVRLKASSEQLNKNLKDPNYIAGAFSEGGQSLKPKITLKPAEITPAKSGIVQLVKKGMVEKDQPIIDELKNIEKNTGQQGLVDKFMYNSNMTRGSNAIANDVIARSPNLKAAIGGLNKDDYKAFSDYALTPVPNSPPPGRKLLPVAP
jgi:hypothetical protein